MRDRVILFLLFYLIFSATYAQNREKRWGFSVDYGSIEYRGELGTGFSDFTQWQGGYGVQLSRYLTPSLNLGIRGSYNSLAVQSTGNQVYSMMGDMYTAMGNLELKFSNGWILPENAAFKPYLKMSGGKMYGSTWGSEMDRKGSTYNETLNDWLYAADIGFKLRLMPHIEAFLEAGNLWLTSDRMDGASGNPGNDEYLRLSVGISFALGHFDDKDGDGVRDKKDRCPNTPYDLRVNRFGCPPDKDDDGVADYIDKCPDQPGSKRAQGCPDRDRDGIPDVSDNCPDDAGPKTNAGCPELDLPENIKPEKKITENDNLQLENEFVEQADSESLIPVAMDQEHIVTSDANDHPIEIDLGESADGVLHTPILESDQDDADAGFVQRPDQTATPMHSGSLLSNFQIKWRHDLNTKPAYFATAQSTLTSYAKANIDELLAFLNSNVQLKVWLFGHADPRGTNEKNKELAEERVQSIINYMISKGINEERIYKMSLGESATGDLGISKEKLRLSRRVDFYLFEMN